MDRINRLSGTPERDALLTRVIRAMMEIIIGSYRYELGANLPDNINYREKSKGPNKGQYGYYINNQVEDIIFAIERLNINKTLDIGAGVGHVVAILRQLGFQIRGIENEPALFEKSRLITSNIFLKDFFETTKGYMSYYDAFYFWEPVFDEKLAERFVKHLSEVVGKDTHILYKCSGPIGFYLHRDPSFIRLEGCNSISIYKKK